MPGPQTKTGAIGAGSPAFATTRWSVVLRAGQTADGDESAQALETLCRSCWYPLYAYIRRLGHPPHDAQDLTQSFFAYLLEKRLLAKADRESGRFRSFLLGSLKNFMANEWRRQSAQKRSAGQTISIDAQDAEARYAVEPATVENPQTVYEQTWAIALLDQAVELLEAEYAKAGKQPMFDLLAPGLQGETMTSTYAELGAQLGMSEGAVKVAMHRLRQRYRELLRAVVAHTVAEPLEVDGELRHLLRVLSR